MSRPLAVRFCLRKKPVTEAEARRHAEQNGLEAYPCPYSQLVRHWHSGHRSARQRSPKWFGTIDRDAQAQGGMGWPDGYAIGVLRTRWAGRETP